VPIKFYPVY